MADGRDHRGTSGGADATAGYRLAFLMTTAMGPGAAAVRAGGVGGCALRDVLAQVRVHPSNAGEVLPVGVTGREHAVVGADCIAGPRSQLTAVLSCHCSTPGD